ncbi:hypothetical protein LUW76_43900 [Actinomadura madurae]|nr:glycine betaine ABC transporter substrate-binding protein [Actinomadura madurae]MCP9955220.1 hypothetical protein [Actinomadura madurae]MCP9971956.1 hypothetical protein [Actinomadura madurae]MCP9984456.1 hypothetical protein [Actinomadura madurae]MCQ0003986.1 hypothetical protein [Actinomadura madurae]MCQ0020651.1 hypothetical protein [Actinomadura madurae]
MRQLGITNLSDYAALAKRDPAKASTRVASEFAGRSGGWPGLQKAYGFTLPKSAVATLAEGVIYDAIGKGRPCAFGEVATTDGRIKALGLTSVPDDPSTTRRSPSGSRSTRTRPPSARSRIRSPRNSRIRSCRS